MVKKQVFVKARIKCYMKLYLNNNLLPLGTSDAIEKFFKSTVERIQKVESSSNIDKTLESITKDLSHIKHMSNHFAAAAEFVIQYLVCKSTILKCRKDRTWYVPIALSTNSCASLYNDAKKIMKLSYHLEYSFSGQTYNNIIGIKSVS